RRAWEDTEVDLDRDARALVTALCDLADGLRALDAGDGLVHAALRASALAGELDAVLDAPATAGARLLQVTGRGFLCQVLPFDVGPKLRSIMDARPAAWVFTS